MRVPRVGRPPDRYPMRAMKAANPCLPNETGSWGGPRVGPHRCSTGFLFRKGPTRGTRRRATKVSGGDMAVRCLGSLCQADPS